VPLSASWTLGPFERHAGAILGPQPALRFHCPIAGVEVAWAAKDVFNPAAAVHEGRVHLLFRAEDHEGPFAGTSRIGLAVSDDGVTFTVAPEPVLFPADDRWRTLEWPGGCEDPRVVASPDGGFVCHYTAFDGHRGVLCVATSPDLRTWTKHGPAFAGTPHEHRWSKSGSVVTQPSGTSLVATRLHDRFWMYWGEGTCFAATSPDLVRWAPVEIDTTADRRLHLGDDGSWRVERIAGQPVLRPVLTPRPGRFDSLLVEPGPPAILTHDGILLVYNGANHPQRGDPSLPPRAYQPGQALFDVHEPGSVLARSTVPFLRPTVDDERIGQVDHVCFAQALVQHEDRWLLYYGMADARIGLATAPAGAAARAAR
jgi:predicted GH43/DUF377 family glycosyl hydrolase